MNSSWIDSDKKLIFIILILLLIWFVFEYGQKYIRWNRERYQNEHFENPSAKSPYFEENVLNNFGDNITGSAVNIRKPGGGVGFFTSGATSGETPAWLKCPSCELQFDCTNFPYEIDDVHGTVCTSCTEKHIYNEFNMPVFAKSIAGPRVYRELKSN